MKNTGALTASLSHSELGGGWGQDGTATASPCRPVAPPWPGPPRAGLTASLPACSRCSIRWLLPRKRVPHFTSFKALPKTGRDQLAYCSVTPQGRRIFRKDIHVRTQPARNSQAPGGTGGRVCTKPPLSSVFCPDLSGILFQCLMGFQLPLLCVWHWAQNGQLSPVSRAKEGGTASSFPLPTDVQVTHPGDLAGLYPD